MSWVLDFSSSDKEKRKQIKDNVSDGLTTEKTVSVLVSKDSPLLEGERPLGVVDDYTFKPSDWGIETSIPISVPGGYSRAEFNGYLERYVTYYKRHNKHPRAVINELLIGRGQAISNEEKNRVTVLINTESFRRALIARGVAVQHWNQDPIKMQALSLLTDPLARGTFEGKLKKLGITTQIWDSWLADREFASEFRKLTEKNFANRQGEVNLALQSMALQPGAKQFEAIKYFNEVTGRHDPSRRQVMDLQQLAQGFIDILQSEIRDPELLMRIAGKLSVLVGGSGAYNNTDTIREVQ